MATILCRKTIGFAMIVLNLAASKTMHCPHDVVLCGFLALKIGKYAYVDDAEGGLSGFYDHPKPRVIGLWPGRASEEDFQEKTEFFTCLPPSDSRKCCGGKVHSCYDNHDEYAQMHGFRDTLAFQEYEWSQHGMCAGIKDADDYFGQICEISEQPLHIIRDEKTAIGAYAVLETAGFEVFNIDENKAMLYLSACMNSKTGSWVLAPAAEFSRICSDSTGIIKIASGNDHTMLLKRDGSVWNSGLNSDGQLGAGSKSFRDVFTKAMSSGAMDVAAGNKHSIILKGDGSVWATGDNYFGQLGDGSIFGTKFYFDFVGKIPGVTQAAAGLYHTVLLANGHIWVTGWNRFGQLGDGSTSDRSQYFQLPSTGTLDLRDAVVVAAGDIHSLMLSRTGSVWATGGNCYGQLGDTSSTDRNRFQLVMGSGGSNGRSTFVAAGGYHSLVLKADTSVWAAGWNMYGQLGDGSTVDRTAFVQVVPSDAQTIAAGSRHSLVLKLDGTVWATGYNMYGQLGDGSTTSRETFIEVVTSGAIGIAAGVHHSMVLKRDHSLWFTGSNKYGQFGDGSHSLLFNTTNSKENFVPVLQSAYDFESIRHLGKPSISGVKSINGFKKQSMITAVSSAAMTPVTTAEAPTTTSASSVSSSKGCPKCGTIKKSGKRSCCARGGAWFKNCGDVGDSSFEHTWVEGMQACKSVESPQAMLSREESTTHPLNISSPALQNPTYQHTNVHYPDGVSDAVHTDSADHLSVAKIFVCAGIFISASFCVF